jgi:hypothetical protein
MFYFAKPRAERESAHDNVCASRRHSNGVMLKILRIADPQFATSAERLMVTRPTPISARPYR